VERIRNPFAACWLRVEGGQAFAFK